MVKKKRLDNHTKRLVWSKLGGKKILENIHEFCKLL
jgi:hypothetical protein